MRPAQPAPPVVEFTRLNSRYWPAITLARLILRSCALEEDQERDIRGSGLLVDMNKLFEDVVGNGLQCAGRPRGVTIRAQYHDRLDADGLLGIHPDIVWLSADRVCAVGDVKYKQPAKPEDVNEDVYQVLAYAARYRLAGAHLIYAARPPIGVLDVAGTTIHLHHVDLELPPTERQAQLDRIACTIGPVQMPALEASVM